MNDEKVLYDSEDVRVTNTRFIVRDHTYAMSNITSVKKSVIEPNRNIPVLIILVGVLTILISNWATGIIVAGAALIAIGAISAYMMKNTYIVKLSTAAGEQRALESKKEDLIQNVVNSLNEAIVYRG